MTHSAEETTRRKSKGRTDWDRLRREEAAGLEPVRDDDEGEFDWSRSQLEMPRPKQAISVRLDADVLDFFKGKRQGIPDANQHGAAQLHEGKAGKVNSGKHLSPEREGHTTVPESAWCVLNWGHPAKKKCDDALRVSISAAESRLHSNSSSSPHMDAFVLLRTISVREVCNIFASNWPWPFRSPSSYTFVAPTHITIGWIGAIAGRSFG